jgi:predicted AlkP superfamily phosphohydrolase/phosphomutase
MWFKKKPRVLVIGLDGTPLSFVKEKMDEGVLPSFKKLLSQGSLVEITSTHPFVSCVAWSTYMTGKNAAKHNIFGFIDRKPGTYSIYIPNGSNMTSKTLWENLSDEGKSVLVMNVPVTYPPRKVNGYLVSGFLAPKIDGGTYPAELAVKLKAHDYELDIDPWRARENLDNLYPDLMRVFKARTQMFMNLYGEKKWDFAQLHVMETDRLYHFMWEHMEQGHPKYAKEFMGVLTAIDEFLGAVDDSVGDDVTIIVMSDHGFCSVRKEIYLNRFLEEKGYLKYKQDDAKSLEHIDPSQTQVFCMDPGRFYINLEGREAQGIVSRADYDGVREKLMADLAELADDEGNKVIKDILTKDEIYSGPSFDIAPDVIINPVDGYDPKGAFGKKTLTGKGPIVGMHTHHDAMLFIRGREVRSGGSVMDVPLAVYDIMGLEPPPDLDSHPLLKLRGHHT